MSILATPATTPIIHVASVTASTPIAKLESEVLQDVRPEVEYECCDTQLEVEDAELAPVATVPEAVSEAASGIAIPGVHLPAATLVTSGTCSQRASCSDTQPEDPLGLTMPEAIPGSLGDSSQRASCGDTQPEEEFIPELRGLPATLDILVISKDIKPEEDLVSDPPGFTGSGAIPESLEACSQTANCSDIQPEGCAISGSSHAFSKADLEPETLTALPLVETGDAFMAATSAEPQPEMWDCKACSFLNPVAVRVCGMCSTAPCLKGWACQACTLHNSQTDLNCAACGEVSRQHVPQPVPQFPGSLDPECPVAKRQKF